MNIYNTILFLSMCLLRADARSDVIVIQRQEPAPGEEAHEHEHVIYHQHETNVLTVDHGVLGDHDGDTHSSVGLLEREGYGGGKILTAGTTVNAESGVELGHAVYTFSGGILATVHYKHPSDHDGHDHDRRRTEEHCEITNIIAGGTGTYLGKAGYLQVCKEGDGLTHEMEFKDPSVSPTVTLDFIERGLSKSDVMAGNITALGDRQILHNVLYDESNTEETGHVVGSGFVVGTDPVVRYLYTAAYDLEDGIITVVGQMSLDEKEKCFELVIVGGKGAYTNAKGIATVCKGDDPDTYVHSVKLSDAAPMTASMSIKEIIKEEGYSYHNKEGELMPGDTVSWTSKIFDGDNEIGTMYGHTTFAGASGTGLIAQFLYEFNDGDKLVMIGDPAEAGTCGFSAIVGGSGKYLGAMGSQEICSVAFEEYDHTVSLEELPVVNARSGAVMKNAGLFTQMFLLMAPLLI